MTTAEKTIIIQDLQCKYATWLSKLNSSLGLNQCPEKFNQENVIITNYLNVIYRYQPFLNPVTNGDIITITLTNYDGLEEYAIKISYGANTLVDYTGTDELSTLLINLCAEINAGTETHKYTCVIVDNLLYLYTYDIGASFSDAPLIIKTEVDTTTINVNVTVSSLLEEDTYLILDQINCLTLSEICSILKEIKKSLINCNCN